MWARSLLLHEIGRLAVVRVQYWWLIISIARYRWWCPIIRHGSCLTWNECLKLWVDSVFTMLVLRRALDSVRKDEFNDCKLPHGVRVVEGLRVVRRIGWLS